MNYLQITSLFQYTLRLTIETGSRFSSVHRVQEYIEVIGIFGVTIIVLVFWGVMLFFFTGPDKQLHAICHFRFYL